jgi:glutaconate CoA-transferase subunit A
MSSKLIPLNQAVDLVPTGGTLALGGMTLYRRPVGFVLALIERYLSSAEPGDLTLLAFTAGYESDLLVGAGLVSRVRSCYFGLEIFGLAPMFTHHANRGEIEIIEETEASLAFGIRAQLAGVGFMAGRGWIGTDLPGLRPDVRTVIDPYSGEELIAFPAVRADVAVIHALRADHDGNAQIGRNKGIDRELPLASGTTIITAEEIVPQLSEADIFAPFVDAVVEIKNGAAPSSCHPLYPMDGFALLEYTEQVSNPDSFSRYLEDLLKPPAS